MHVLCVDDDDALLDLTGTLLERKLPTATVYTATRTEEAFDVLESEPVDCIVSDYDMPGKTGLEFLESVREDRPDLPFILFTGKGSEEIASDAISAGVTDYLQKRGTEQYDRLATRIQNAVKQYRTRHELRERVKELSTIQTIGSRLADDEHPSQRRLQAVVDRLPESLQFPDRGVASLDIGSETFRSEGYEPPSETLAISGVTMDGDDITLTIGYVGETPVETDDGPFLPEERELLETVLQLINTHLDRQQILSELREANRRFRLVLENTTAVMYLKDTDGRYVFVNAEYERLFGVDPDAVVGRTDEELHPTEMTTEVTANDERVLETGEPLEVEERITVDGDDRIYLSLKVPARNDAGEIEGIFGVSTDITDRKRSEQQLRAERQFVRGIFRSLPDVLYAFDVAGTPVRWNDRLNEVTGYTDEEVESMYVTDFIPDEDVEAVETAFRTILETQRPITIEAAVETAAGEVAPYEFAGGAIEDVDGKLRGVAGIGRDISERKRREQRLEALNHTVKRLLAAERREDVAQLGIDAAREVLGLEASSIHLYDEPSGTLVPVATTDRLAELIGDPPTFTGEDSVAWRIYESGTATVVDDVHEEPEIYNPDTPIESELYVPLGEYGILIAASTTASAFDRQDVTIAELLGTHLTTALDQIEHERQRQGQRTELERQNERLDQFTSMMSHDLQNPVSIAVGRLELYRETGEASDLDAVEDALDRVKELVTDLTSLARHGGSTDEHEPVSLASVASEAWEMIDTRSATLSVEDRTISGDASQLQGLFENLFRNAVGHGGADVAVRVGPLDTGFFVEDTGAGIPPEEAEDVFEHGYSSGYGGSGIGLTIVSRIAAAHGLDVSLAESSEGGARFEFRELEDGEET